jgi:predicted RNA-binding protein YlxR (DUF448 family)
MKKPVLRKCIVTHVQKEKKDLLRVVRLPSGEVVIDKGGRVYGRGAYLDKSLDAIALARKTKALDKALEVKVPDEIYDELEGLVNGR